MFRYCRPSATRPKISINVSKVNSDTRGMSGIGICLGGMIGVSGGPSSGE